MSNPHVRPRRRAAETARTEGVAPPNEPTRPEPGIVAAHRAPPAASHRVEIDPSEPPEHRFRRVLGAYLTGAAEIVIREDRGLGATTRTVVEAFCRRTAGMELAFEGPCEIRLREPASAPPVPLERKVEAIGRAVVLFHREAVERWGVLPYVLDEEWERKDDAVDRDVWYVQRRLAQGGSERPSTVVAIWTAARSLERIADHAVILGRLGPRLVAVPGAEGLLRTLRQYHAQAMAHLQGSLRSDDPASANRWLDVGEALLASGAAWMDRLLPVFEEYSMPPSGAAAVSQALESTRRTIAYAQDIAELPLNAHPRSATLPSAGWGAGRRPFVMPRAPPVGVVAERWAPRSPGRTPVPAQ